MKIDSPEIDQSEEKDFESGLEEIVRCHIDLVYSVAIRLLDGRRDLAADVSQTVFIAFSRKVRSLPANTVLAAWFHHAARLAALAERREEFRRTRREQVAANLQGRDGSDPETDWAALRPVLDDVLEELAGPEREAVILRFFQQRTFPEVGKDLGITENAARMRVNRALESLRQRLYKRNVISTAGALTTLLTTHAVTSAPVGLASIVAAAVPALTTVQSTYGFMTLFSTTKLKMIAISVASLGVAAPMILQFRNNERLRQENTELSNQLDDANARLKMSIANAGSVTSELAQLREAKDELARSRGQLAELQRRIALSAAAATPTPVAVTTSETSPVAIPEHKVVIYGEMQGSFILPEGEVKKVSDALIELPRSQFADLRRVRLHRVDPATGSTEIKIVNVDKVLREGDRTDDEILKNGDRIEVRPRTFNF